MTYTITNLPTNPGNKNVKKSSLYGLLGSTLSCIILFLIMWFYVMPYTAIVQPVEEEGLMISFGNSDDGGGVGEELMGTPNEDPAPSKIEETTTTKPEPVTRPIQTTTTSVKSTSQNDYISQSEASLAIAEKRKQVQQEKAAQLAIENARIATEKRIADQKRKEQDAINKANSSMSGLFGNSTSAGNGNGTGTGSGEGPGRQGNPAGKGYSGGHSWSLNGRSLSGTLASPSYDKDVEGKVTVNIRVDENGRVISASIGSPTTISDADTRNAAISAANRAHFSSGSGNAAGSITYYFRLK
ncbi:MAG TPA: energy transducer TonB [Paludibacter sp.]|nr:energy transducer TonB [Paludibacter sp.]